MKTILFISHKMNLGGTEKALLSLLNALQKEQLQLTLLLCERGGVLESQIPNFVTVKYLKDFDKMKPVVEDPPQQTFFRFLKNYQLYSALSLLLTYIIIKISGNWYHNYRKVLRQTPHFGTYDIAIAFAGPADFISYFVLKKVHAQKKIQWIHFDIEKVLRDYNFGNRFYSSFDQVFCVSQSAKDNFLKHFPQLTAKTEVFHNIVSGPEMTKCSNEGSTFIDDFKGIRVLTVGRLTREKGQHLIPEVVARLKAENFEFQWYLVGDGTERYSIEQITAELHVQEHLIFLGEKINPYPYMKDCDIYVQPSLHEGYGITVAEAQVFNKPIVVTNFASAKDLIINNETGLICEISSEGIYEAVKSLLINSDLQTKFIANSLYITSEKAENISKLLN